MKFSWLILGALGAGGCSSQPESEPQPTPAPILIPTVAPTPTISPFLQMPTPTQATPEPVFGNAADAPPTSSSTADDAQQTDEAKRQQVADLRSDMTRLQNQRSALEQRKAEFGARNPNARAEERALGASSPNDAQMAQYNQQMDDIDSQLRAKQKQIDDLIISS